MGEAIYTLWLAIKGIAASVDWISFGLGVVCFPTGAILFVVVAAFLKARKTLEDAEGS